MRRILLFVLEAAILVGLAVLAAEHEGAVSVEWLGHRIDTSTTVVLLALVVVIAVAALLYRFWRALVTAPRRWARGRAVRRRERGYRALTLGLVAAAAGDHGEARRQSRRTDGLLGDHPLGLMLAAQAAQLGGDAAGARRLYDRMLNHPDTAFLGLRGLIAAALEAGDHRAALGYAARARALAPDAPWLLERLFDIHAALGDWTAAAAIADRAARRRALEGPELQRRLALAEQAERDGRIDAAIRHARAAAGATPGGVPAVTRLARLYLVAGRHRDA